MKKSSTNILLVNANLMKPPVTPVAIDYLASALRSGGYTVKFLDLAFENDVELALERELKQDPLFVGVTIRNVDDSFFASRDFCLAKVKPIVQKIKDVTHAPVVLGGVGYSIFPFASLEYCAADFGVQGDGEGTIVRFARALSRSEDVFDIPGLVWRVPEGYGKKAPVPVELSIIDLSDRSTVNNRRYLREGGMVGFETKRGCNAPCSYCADPLAKGTTCRQRPPEQVAREIASLVEIGIDHFHTCDSEFNIPPSHALEICQAFIRKGLGEHIRWYAYMTPVHFEKELASSMKHAGCAGINFGADHCNPAILRTLRRAHTADSIAEASRLCRKYGIPCMFDLLLGAPGETKDTLREVVEFMKNIDPYCVGASMGLRVYPGTAIARQLTSQLKPNTPGVYGMTSDNTDLLRPVYYLSPELGENPLQLLFDLVKGDDRFFIASPQRGAGDYNYNNNSVLSEAIRSGKRGAFWHILRQLRVPD